MRREGSPWRGLGVVILKELADHLTSVRMLVIELLVVVTGVVIVLVSLQQIRDVTAEDPFLFLRVFTRSGEQLSFVFVLTLLVPLIAIGLGFDLVNSEHNQRTLSRILSQPIYRDALLFGKFLAGLAHDRDQPDRAVAAGDRAWPWRRSACRRAPRRLARAALMLVVTIAYAGVWLALAMLFSILFRSAATAALVRSGCGCSCRFCGRCCQVIWSTSSCRCRRLGRRTAQQSRDASGLSAAVARSLVRRDRDGAARSRGALDPAVAARGDGAYPGRARFDPRCAAAVAAKPADRVAADRQPDRRHDRAVRDRLRHLPAPGSARLAHDCIRASKKQPGGNSGLFSFIPAARARRCPAADRRRAALLAALAVCVGCRVTRPAPPRSCGYPARR